MCNDTDDLIKLVNSKILDYTGIYVAESQYKSLIDHIEKKAAGRGVSPVAFVKSLIHHTPEFDEIINLITVNETFFFREEMQFDFLKNEVFPKYFGKELLIWSCCCSTGEEAISLLTLALSMNVDLTIYASDIDDNALAALKKGRYSVYSLRTDGQKYHKLLEPYCKKTETEIIFEPSFIERIKTFKFNVLQDDVSRLPFYDNVDILFMRNVFIYFDKNTRRSVVQKLTHRIKTNGLLFLSINEVGSIDNSVIPHSLSKINSGMVYYFIKNYKNGKSLVEVISEERNLQQRIKNQKKQVIHHPVEKPKVQKTSEEKKKKTILEEKQIELDIKLIYESVCTQINEGNFEKARSIAKNIPGTDLQKYSFFMQGYVEYQADNRAVAGTFFASAENVSPDFWPAYFYHGMVLRDLGQKEHASGCFSKCKTILSDFENRKGKTSIPYDFTLDSFSPSYIYSLCDTFTEGGGL